ncbi:PfkB family carbohydrate kinase [Cellulosimicrobium arenosum]|uniref:Bifunctional hydroxymethylpyrimidine kinase/phosphomethylpyrimidine kinase n=1 Tax=Cellulosimicrobium arenosum TaxID=2708133 RepID=A0A927J173_9MICO|nr:PfkB family carbohydrate kinase [Cellulosimicrobium arenosum]MBD8079902.1 bifunctional hydroxymethylpyrimidine kinase/phosphomethylpyrimidine kinase [Cellulosimicrobium arenosum]
MPKVVHTGQAIVDLVMEVDRLPTAGGDVFASAHRFAVGGGFNTMSAASRDGATVVYAGGHGTGPFGDMCREAMAAEGIAAVAPVGTTMDSGFCVAIVDGEAERTFVSTLGAEGQVTIEDYRAADVGPEDVVYVSGYSLLHARSREALLTWLPDLPSSVTLVVDPSPVIGQVPADVVRAVAQRADVWTSNEDEATELARMLDIPGSGSELTAAVALSLRCTVVLRRGGADTLVAVADDAVRAVPVPAVRAVDTNGAGDAHTGVLCAAIAGGLGLDVAVRRANAAAALAVTRRGPATSPTASEIDALLDRLPSQ